MFSARLLRTPSGPQANKNPRTFGSLSREVTNRSLRRLFLLKMHSWRRHVLDSHHQSLEQDWFKSSSHVQAPSVLRMHRGRATTPSQLAPCGAAAVLPKAASDILQE